MLKAITLWCVVGASLPVAAQSRDLETGVSRAGDFVGLLLKVQPGTGKLTAAQKAANEKVFRQLDSLIDFEHFTTAPIAPRADKFSKEQKADFAKKFREVIRLVAYPDSGSFFRKAKYSFGKGTEKEGIVLVPISTRVVKDDLETEVTLHFRKNAWKIVDVSFDGDSLVKDYQNQMIRIIDKDGAKGLIAVIEKRYSEMKDKLTEK